MSDNGGELSFVLYSWTKRLKGLLLVLVAVVVVTFLEHDALSDVTVDDKRAEQNRKWW